MFYWYLKQVWGFNNFFLSVPSLTKFEQARSSVGERHLDVVDAGGSIPPAPTKIRG